MSFSESYIQESLSLLKDLDTSPIEKMAHGLGRVRD